MPTGQTDETRRRGNHTVAGSNAGQGGVVASDRDTLGIPRDQKTGLTLPLSRFLGSQDLAKHRAMVAFELEVIAKKLDRYGWERDRNTPAHDRLLTDWMDALCDFPLEEVRAACRAWVLDNPRKVPNEGDIHRQVMEARRRVVASLPKPNEPELVVVSAAQRARAAEIVREIFKEKQ